MNIDNIKEDMELKGLLKKGELEIPHNDFEEKVMQKIMAVKLNQGNLRKNIKIAWVFLAVSVLLFPTGFIAISNHLNFAFLPQIGESINSISDVFMPAGILLFSVIILLQVDNLLKLTFRTSL